MKTSPHTRLGLGLVALGALFLVARAPAGPSWFWGLLGGALLLWLRRRGAPAEAAALGAALLGWSLGALAADGMGLESLKLAGTGAGLGLWGGLERREAAAWAGGALVVAAAVVFFWESPGGLFLALALLAFGTFLLLKPPAASAASAKGKPDEGEEDAFLALVRWRNRVAAEKGRTNVEALSDAELGCVAALANPLDAEAVKDCLEKGGAPRAARIVKALREGSGRDG